MTRMTPMNDLNVQPFYNEIKIITADPSFNLEPSFKLR